MLGADEIFLFLGHQTIFPICGQYSFGFIATLLDGKFPDLRSADYKVSRTQAIRKISSNEYRTQVMLSRSTHGDTYTLTHFEHMCYMPLILNFPINVDLTVTRNLPGPAIKFARVTRQVFRSPKQSTVLPHKGALLLQPRGFTVSIMSVIPLK